MTTYRYKISLRIEHPSIDPVEITERLGRNPTRSWKVGEPRTTPKRAALNGCYQESFWTGRLIEGNWPDDSLPTAVDQAIDGLEAHAEFFHRLRSEGGVIELFVGWFLGDQGGDVFEYRLLRRLADLAIDLSFDLYPPDPPLEDDRE